MSAVLMAYRPRKAMSLTALIDVVFILLLFFMLTSTFDKTKSIELLTASQGQESVDASGKLQLVRMQAAGKYSLLNDDKPTQEFANLDALLKGLNVQEKVVLLPNEQTLVQQIVETLEYLGSNNIADVTLGNVLSTAKGK